MAYGYINFVRSTNGYKVVLRAKSLLGVGTHDEAHAFLATDETESNDELAAILNYQQTKLMNRMPILNQRTTSVTMTADTRTTTISSSVRGNMILDLYYNDSTEFEHRRRVQVVPLDEIRNRAPEWINGTYTEDWPSFAVISEDDHSTNSRFEWYGLPTTTRTLTMLYQPAEAAFTYADISSGASTKYVMVPDDMVDVLALFIAAAMAKRYYGALDKRATDLEAQAEKELRDWSNQMRDVPAAVRSRRWGLAGHKPDFEGGKFPSFTRPSRRGGSSY